MKALIGIISCERFSHRAHVQRETWVWDAINEGIDVRFFVGRDYDGPPFNDTVVLPVGDGYLSIPLKVQAMFKWSVENDYDFTLKTDDDTLVIPHNLKACFKDSTHWLGRVRGPSGAYPIKYDGKLLPSGMELYGPKENSFCSGLGYILDKQSATVVANAQHNGDWAEDRWVGQVLHSSGIRPQAHGGFALYPFSSPTRMGRLVVVCPHNEPHAVARLYNEAKAQP